MPELDTDRINGIINRIASEDVFDDVSWILGEPVVNFTQNVVDRAIRDNADFHAKAGFEPKIIRTANRGACEWCRSLEGTYSYGDVRYQGAGVWRRHGNCRCLIEFTPEKGRRQTVYNYREENTPEGRERLENRKTVGKEDNADYFVGKNGKVLPAKYRDWIGQNQMEDYLQKAESDTAKRYIRTDFRKTSFIGDESTAAIREF